MKHSAIEYDMNDDRYHVVPVNVGTCTKLEFVALTLDNRKFHSRAAGANYLRSRGWSQIDTDAYLMAIRSEVVS